MSDKYVRVKLEHMNGICEYLSIEKDRLHWKSMILFQGKVFEFSKLKSHLKKITIFTESDSVLRLED